MVAQITASNDKFTVVYRFIGRKIYLKCIDKTYAAQIIQQIKSKGGNVKDARDWLLCDILGSNQIAKLGPAEVNTMEDSEEDIEVKFFNFFKFTLEKAGFKCETMIK